MRASNHTLKFTALSSALLEAVFHVVRCSMPFFMCIALAVSGAFCPRVTPSGRRFIPVFGAGSAVGRGTWDAVLETLRVEVRYAQGRKCPSERGQCGLAKHQKH